MRKTILLIFLFSAFRGFTQLAPPQAFSYSAVARDGFGNPLVNQSVGIQFSILKGSTVGPMQYQENHFTTTNQFGVFTLTIGTGAVQSGNFTTINWGSDAYYLKVGLDATGGTNFQIMGTTQFLSVPYALYSGKSGEVDGDTSATNEIQTLGIAGNTLSISQGNQIVLPTINDHDTSSTNELQNLSFSNDSLAISGGNKVVLPYNAQTNFTVKINGVSISDPSINFVIIDHNLFLTSTNYQVVGTSSIGSDSLNLFDPMDYIHTTSSNCNPPYYAWAESNYGAGTGLSPGKIFSHLGSVYYIPLGAATTTLSNTYYNSGSCDPFAGAVKFYLCVANNPVVTGFNFNTTTLKVTYER